MELHLDCLGGLAGDMFVACVLDAYPEHRDAVLECVERLKPAFAPGAAACGLVAFTDGVFAGSRFVVPPWPAVARVDAEAGGSAQGQARAHRHDDRRSDAHEDGHGHSHGEGQSHSHDHDHDHDHDHSHSHSHSHSHDHSNSHDPHPQASPPPPGHVAWADIRARLQGLLPPGVLHHAVGIFGQLATAEAAVHGVSVDAVEFHEVGAWDSVVDIVAAATLIDRLDARRWTVSALPLGAGRVRSAHGPMPVPPPATALLLRGFALVDDGIGGERVTPTGAAILRHLLPDGHDAPAAAPREPRLLRLSGVGFGSRRLDGISNCVRLLAFDAAPVAAPPQTSAHRELAVVEFEVDDQSAEELAMGLDRLRGHDAVFDVVQAPVFGKKGRMMTSVRLLARPAELDAVLDACFRETTTIGLRHTTVRGRALPRRSDEVVVDGHRLRVKTVERPGGATAKAESDDALAHETHQARRRIREEAERRVLDAASKGRHDD